MGAALVAAVPLVGGVLGVTSAGAAETPQPVTVRIAAGSLDPASVQIEPGATVVWVNKASTTRSVLAADASFDSGELAPGERFQFAFTEARSVQYAVVQSPGVTGTIVVGDAAAAPAPTPFAPAASGPSGPPPSEFAYTGSATSVNALIGGLSLAVGAGLLYAARRVGVVATLSRLAFSMPLDDVLPTRRHRRMMRTRPRRGRPRR